MGQFLSQTVILETLRFHFGTLSDHFGDPGVHRDTQQAPWGPGVHFYRFYGVFGESPGTHFRHISVIFLWFGVAKCETVSRSMFLMILGWKCCLNAVSVCAITIIKLWFLNGFTFSTYSEILCPEGGLWVTFRCLLVTLGALFLIFEGLGDRLEIWWFFPVRAQAQGSLCPGGL